MENYIDAVEAASENYKLLSEEGKIRVIEMNLPVGVIDNEHSHHSETVYFIQGGKLRIHVGGEAMEADIPDGHVMQTHRVENIGDKDIKAVIFETMP